jgi:hypothetical protein
VADTGSLEPIPEAVEWAQRADAWAQRQPEGDQGGQVERTRWNEVATGRPAFPADGVGWRTETAEWRATEQTARWRQTTEWRSSSGTHGWRSTTEAWQTGAGAEGFRPPVDPQTRQQLAISGTAWPTPQGDEQPIEGTSTWQQPADNSQNGAASWQRFTEPATPAAEARPAWQQFAAPPAPWEQAGPVGTPSWEQAAPGSAVPWQQSASAGAPWQQDAPGSAAPWQDAPATAAPWQNTPATTASWQDAPASATPWQGAAPSSAVPWQDPAAGTASVPVPRPGAQWQPGAAQDPRPGEQTPGSSWQQLVEPKPPIWGAGATSAGENVNPPTPRSTWQSLAADPGTNGAGPATYGGTNGAGSTAYGASPYTETRSVPFDGRHLVREDDRAQWRREAQDDGQRPGGRRRAAEPGSRTSGGTGWSTRSDSDNWAGHADTGSMEMLDDPGATNAPSWGSRSEAPGWRADRDEPAADWRTGSDSWRAEPDSGSWSRGEEQPRRRGAGDRRQIGWQPAADERDDDGDMPGRRPGGRRAAAPETPSWQRSAPAAIGWQPEERDDTEGPGWRQDPRWQDERQGRGWRETGSATGARRRAAEPADPWAQSAADTGIIPLTGQQPTSDTGSWRSSTGAVGRARPMNPNRRRDEPGDTSSRLGAEPRLYETGTRNGRRRADFDEDVRPASAAPISPEVWRREPGSRTDGANWPEEAPPDDWRRDLQPVEPPDDWRRDLQPGSGAWQREERAAAERGSASYRGENTGDWRRAMAAETSTNLVDGESRRFGTQDFVPFRPVGSASVPVSASAPPTSPAAPTGPREELLVGSGVGGRQPGAEDMQWPPRQSTGYQSAQTGSYERRPVGGGLDIAPSRQNNLLEPDEDELEEDTGGPLAAVGYTVIWYGVPVVLFVLYMLVLNGSQQAHALSTLAGAAPQFGLSLVLSMVVAVGLRWASGSWKAASVGLAAAVMGGGLATVLSSAITGNSLS